ncbi:VOC family protein [uncultured Dokdonia sp.]|uniref:VOC family protein n=1 Tax=uncultured Dokdonia sp. TaxID=575653 RepID=UPI002602EE39|nr:VOC family protein [uncultured Dokdonia sp.]
MKFSIDHYAINVTDLDRSVTFYQSIFGIKEIYNGTQLDHIKWFRLGEHQELHIISVEKLDLQIPKGVHLALTTANLSLFINHLNSLGITYYDWPGKKGAVSIRPDTIEQIYIQDPDGYWIEINDGEKRFK